jgi:hypothetical protein
MAMTEPGDSWIGVLQPRQRALQDLVTPDLRAVAVSATCPVIAAGFIYEAMGDDERLLTAEAEAYVVADFAPPVDVRFKDVVVPTVRSRELLAGEEWVYRRREVAPE